MGSCEGEDLEPGCKCTGTVDQLVCVPWRAGGGNGLTSSSLLSSRLVSSRLDCRPPAFPALAHGTRPRRWRGRGGGGRGEGGGERVRRLEDCVCIYERVLSVCKPFLCTPCSPCSRYTTSSPATLPYPTLPFIPAAVSAVREIPPPPAHRTVSPFPLIVTHSSAPGPLSPKHALTPPPLPSLFLSPQHRPSYIHNTHTTRQMAATPSTPSTLGRPSRATVATLVASMLVFGCSNSLLSKYQVSHARSFRSHLHKGGCSSPDASHLTPPDTLHHHHRTCNA